MPSPDERYDELAARLATLDDLATAGKLLGWDHQTMMPPGGATARADVVATVGRVAHELAVDDALLELLDEVRPWAESLPDDDVRADVVRVARRDAGLARLVPVELAVELSLAASRALPVWERARAESDFASFAPCLQRNVELRRELAATRPDVAHPYDALLDAYEPGMTTAAVRDIFDRLRAGLAPLIAELTEGRPAEPLEGPFAVGDQRLLALEIARSFGFDDEHWRLDGAVHPFASSQSTGDIRVTARFNHDNVSGLFAVMHEVGHGLYERQVDPALARTTLGSGTSYGIHESQSRLWENLVGRGRAFWTHWLPRAQDVLPGVRDHGLDDFLRAINRVSPDLIRVDADEATYSLHVILRFELEVALLTGDLSVGDLPGAWNDGMRDLLGVTVPDDRRGVLQDIHWAYGELGYFPAYALGTVAAAQFWRAAQREVAGLDEAIAGGDVAPLRDWLGERVHRHGRRLDPPVLLQRVTGSSYDPEALLEHLRTKFAELYGLGA